MQATPDEPNEVADWWSFTFAPDQKVFRPDESDLRGAKANGLKLRPTAPACQPLVLWDDGSMAIGLRRLGKGCVIHMGLKFCREPLWHGWSDRTTKLFRQIFEWAGMDDDARMAVADVDDSAWPVRRLDCWAVPEEISSRHVLFRKTFQVPAQWHDGDVELWLRAWCGGAVVGKARYWLDGKEITRGDGAEGLVVSSGWATGSKHLLTVEVRGEGQVCGVRGNTWLAFTRRPAEILDLAGRWTPSKDYLTNGPAVSLPGPFNAKLVSRDVDIPARLAGKQLYLRRRASWGITGCIVNGRYVRRHHHCIGDTTFLNITLWLIAGKANQIEILGPGENSEIKELSLCMY